MKEDIQDLIDDIVESYKDSNLISTFCGVRLEEFEKHELIAICKEVARNKMYGIHSK